MPRRAPRRRLKLAHLPPLHVAAIALSMLVMTALTATPSLGH